MKLIIAGVLAASTLALSVPASAQGIYIGPRGGVGIGAGVDPYYGGDGYGDQVYEGRSASRRGSYHDGYDQYDDDHDDIDGF